MAWGSKLQGKWTGRVHSAYARQWTVYGKIIVGLIIR